MIKTTFLAIIALCVCSTNCYADDVFLSFGTGADASSNLGTADLTDGTGSAFVFIRNGFDLDVVDVLYANSDNSVIEITNAEVFNSVLFDDADNTRFDTPVTNTVDPDGTGRLSAIAITQLGISSSFSGFDEDFDTVADAFLFAQIDYNIVGTGTTDLTLSLGPILGIAQVQADGDPLQLEPVFRSGTLTVINSAAIPEPSSAGLLAVALVGILTRRRR